nr:MAG TPA: hypothetical protein [Siphoviridae sp. ctEci12]
MLRSRLRFSNNPNVASLRDVVVDSVAMPALYAPDAAFKAQVL